MDKAVVVPGSELTYTLALGNEGTDTAVNLLLEDSLPANTSFVSATGGGVLDGDTVRWTAPSLVPGVSGSVSLTVRVDSPLDNGTTLYNAAAFGADNAVSVTDDQSSVVSSSPLLSLDKRADSDFVTPGAEVTYRLEFSNTGNADASGVVLEEVIPEYTSFVSASDGGSIQGSLVVWQLGDLPAGTSGEVTVTFQVDAPPLADGTQIRNFATFSTLEAPSVSARETVTVQSAPMLNLEKQVDRQFARPGDTLTYSLSLENAGTDTAANIQVADQLPGSTTFLFATGDYTIDGQLLSWEFAELQPGENLELVVAVSIDSPLSSGTVLENTAAAQADVTQAISDSAVTRVLSAPLLRLEKTTPVPLVRPGDLIEYTLTFGNDGTEDAVNGALLDQIPGNSTFVSATGGGVMRGDSVVWPVPQLPAGGESSVGLTIRVNEGVSNGDLVTNTSALTMSGETPVTSVYSVPVQASPVLLVEKSSTVSEARPGDVVQFDLRYENAGNDTATDTLVEDRLPQGTAFVSAPGAIFDGSTIRWSVGDLEPGVTGDLTMNLENIAHHPGGVYCLKCSVDGFRGNATVGE